MTTFSSRDFWRVPSALTAVMPERIHHRAVRSALSSGAKEFSSARKHRVHIVDLPSITISMTLGTLQPMETTTMHRHNYETLIYIMAGRGVTRIQDATVNWEVGDALYIPVWAFHQHESLETEEICTYIACENAPLLQNLGGVALREELQISIPEGSRSPRSEAAVEVHANSELRHDGGPRSTTS